MKQNFILTSSFPDFIFDYRFVSTHFEVIIYVRCV